MTDGPSIRAVLDFWFLPLQHPEHGTQRDIWWQSTAAFDAEIRQRFGAAIAQAIAGELDHWRRSPDGALALVVLTDQFTRNAHRRTAAAFAGDAKALETARFALARGHPWAFAPTLRQFFYMPFQHSEQLADQELACALIAALEDEEAMKHAVEHREVVARFGRFPHRNEVLGRACTPAERDYLERARRYGQ
jgi:uncharacterized protein (DUF924 family)